MSNKYPNAFGFPVPSQYALPGMTLRDWFAGQALAGWLASSGEEATVNAQYHADFAYEVADAMMKARQ